MVDEAGVLQRWAYRGRVSSPYILNLLITGTQSKIDSAIGGL